MTSTSASLGHRAAGGPADGQHEWHGGLARLAPLLRHAVWAVAVFALLTLWVDIRVDVQQLRSDLDRSGRARREAQVQNDRLRLEFDAERRALALEAMAADLGIRDGADVIAVTVPASPGSSSTTPIASAQASPRILSGAR